MIADDGGERLAYRALVVGRFLNLTQLASGVARNAAELAQPLSLDDVARRVILKVMMKLFDDRDEPLESGLLVAIAGAAAGDDPPGRRGTHGI
jgi:hypothetical protein